MIIPSLLILSPLLVQSICPGLEEGTPITNQAPIPDLETYNEALSSLSIVSVIHDIKALLTDSQECWPSDTFSSGSSYGPLFIRLAWHCSGTFRNTDGAGGCAGGRQRFWPEASWDDNTNLDKARALLAPIKNKYGDALSWGDLMVFAGTGAIYSMGGPVTEICAGRIDSPNGNLSEPLGPGPQAPDCEVQGNCPEPLGADTIGLIYVNPEGVMGNPDPDASATRIREIFGRMGMNDSETVALIGGGHAFGKSHGACPNGAGLPPNEAPTDPWPGLCGTGNGEDTFTSGIEGQWTTDPLKWDNEYFEQLINDDYNLTTGDGDKYQWENTRNGYMMLTTDLALVNDEVYKGIVTEFADDLDALNEAFANAWEKLTTSGGVWAEQKKCIDVSDLESTTTTQAAEESEEEVGQTDDEVMWMTIAIVFIVLFVIALIVIGIVVVMGQKDKGAQKKKGGEVYKATANADEDV